MKWVCLNSTISVSHAYWTIKSHKLILKVVFLFQNFLVLTIYMQIHTNLVRSRSKNVDCRPLNMNFRIPGVFNLTIQIKLSGCNQLQGVGWGGAVFVYWYGIYQFLKVVGGKGGSGFVCWHGISFFSGNREGGGGGVFLFSRFFSANFAVFIINKHVKFQVLIKLLMNFFHKFCITIYLYISLGILYVIIVSSNFKEKID